jgi:hypothetical protein
VSGWNGLSAKDRRSRARSKTAAAGLLARRKALLLSRQVQSRPLPFLQAEGTDARPRR